MTTHFPLLLAQVSPSSEETFGETLLILAVGFCFVLTVLVLLSIITALIGRLFVAWDARNPAAKEQPDESVTSLDPMGHVVSMADDPELVSVIAAAIHTCIGEQPHRIISIQRTDKNWAQEGRRQIFGSHRVR